MYRPRRALAACGSTCTGRSRAVAESLFDDLPPPPSNGPYARPLGHYRVPAEVPPNPTVPDEARPRVSRQCREILERLREGPATNKELAAKSLKYTSRLSEIREAGYTVRCVAVDIKNGVYRYELG
jgi:hypothetical protein